MRRRQLLGALAGVVLLAGGAGTPVRADTFLFPSAVATARTADGANVGTVRVQLKVEEGNFRHGGHSWACKYNFRVEFDSLDDAWVTAVEPSSCGHPYSLDPSARGKEWNTSVWQSPSSRLLRYSINRPQDGIPAFGTATFTSYTNAQWAVGPITVRGVVMTNSGLQHWVAEVMGHTMGCVLKNAPAEPLLKVGLSSSKKPAGTGNRITVTMTIANEGGATAEEVLLTMDPFAYAAYVPESSTANGELFPDVGGLPAVLNGGVLATLEPGDVITLGFDVVVGEHAAGQALKLAAHAALEGYPTVTAREEVPIIQTVAPKLSMSMSVAPNPVGTGELLTATIKVKNDGNGDANGVLVTLNPGANLSYKPGTTAVNGVDAADVGGQSALAGGLYVNVPAGGVTTITWSGKVANTAGGSTLHLVANGSLPGHDPVSASAKATVVESIPAAFDLLISTIDGAQAAGAFRFKFTGHPLFNSLAQEAKAAWQKGDKKTAIARLDRIMYLATWRGRFGLTAELFHVPGPINWAGEIHDAAAKVKRHLLES